jgi:hypothetical protein
MFYILSILGAFTLGAISGILVYRNNAIKLKAAEDKGKNLLDVLKGR